MKFFTLIIFVIFFLTGCVVSNKKDISINGIPMLSKDNGKANDINSSLPKTVAIIPFLSSEDRASEVVTRYFYNSFSALKYKDIELDVVYRVLKDKSLEEINNSDIKTLGKLLGVDGILIGRVTDFDKLFLGLYSSVTVGAKIKFYNTKSGETIWEFDENAKKREGGVATTPIGIAVQLAFAAYNLRDVQLYRAAEDLFRDVFTTIPEPKYSGIEELPKLKFVINNIKSKKAFKAGDELLFSLDSEKDLEVYVSIPAEKNLVKMAETVPGHYEASYIISKNISNAKGSIEYFLRRKNGIEARYFDLYGELKIDNIPPSKPEIQYTIKNNKVNLTLLNTEGDEISSYKVYKLENNEYKEFINSSSNEITFDINEGDTIYLKPYLVDLAGNYSNDYEKAYKLSNLKDKRVLDAKVLENEVGDMNLKDTYVIKNDIQITGNLRIKSGAVLFINPNVKVDFKTNGRIINEGGELLIYGTNDKKINMKSQNELTILSLNSGSAIIEHCNILTNKAIILENGATLIASNLTVNSNYEGIHLKDSSTIDLKFSSISVQKDMSDIIFEGSSTGNINKVAFGNNNIFDVTSSSKKTPKVKNSGKIKVLGAVDVEE